MKAAYVFLLQLLRESREIAGTNFLILLLTFAILILALIICIHISRKNKLYINPVKQEPLTKLYNEKEVAS